MNILNEFFYKKRASTFDGFVEFSLIKEGLITSYNVEKLQLKIKDIFKNRVIFGEDKPLFDWHSYSFVINVFQFSKDDEKEVKKLLDLFGYYITKIENYTFKQRPIAALTIEPKYPIIINNILKERNVTKLYHITDETNLAKIQNQGLAPRGSETTFEHPKDRIYLIYTENPECLKAFANVLKNDKLIKFRYTDLKMVLFETPFNDNYQYYLDDSVVTGNKNTYGCFILKNIPPRQLTQISFESIKN